MDPVATVLKLSATSVRVLVQLSHWVDQVRAAPKAVHSLSQQISTMHLAIGELKIALNSEQAASYFARWDGSFDGVLSSCLSHIEDIGMYVEKAKVKNTTTRGGEIFKSVKWTFDGPKVHRMQERLESHRQNLMLLLQVLSRSVMVRPSIAATSHSVNRSRDDEAHKMIQDTHKWLQDMERARKDIRETIGILAPSAESQQQADVLIHDLRGQGRGQPHQTHIFTPEQEMLLAARCPSPRDLEIVRATPPHKRWYLSFKILLHCASLTSI